MREQKYILKNSAPCSPNDKKLGKGFEYQGAEETGAVRFTKNLFLSELEGVPGSPITNDKINKKEIKEFNCSRLTLNSV